MLSELEGSRPLKKGMRVFDPSCGSGAFLVQCYRRLIEKEFPFVNRRPSPLELRKLLKQHIFGVDSDPDACSVTELSLILTLLDYVNPPDLENRSGFKLPALRNHNIFCDDFFQRRCPMAGRVVAEKVPLARRQSPVEDAKSKKAQRRRSARLGLDDEVQSRNAGRR